jgi:hypothetical protein
MRIPGIVRLTYFYSFIVANCPFEEWGEGEAEKGANNRAVFHDFFLSLWGTPIGEAWDLEKLAETCERLGRWSFLLTSAPLNVPGGVASPPNAIAIF